MTRRYRIRTFSQLVAAMAVWPVNFIGVNQIPKLNLPSFGGDYLSWQTFWNSFIAAVDSSPVLSGIQKFNYLRNLLKGEAARVVTRFPLTDVNYLHSVEILKERFGQTQKIVNAHMQSLLNLPTPRNTLIDLRAFYDSIASHIQGLAVLSGNYSLFIWCFVNTYTVLLLGNYLQM